MTFSTLIRRSLRFHARAHLGVVLGAAIGSAALIGALIVGDSVRGSLRQRALDRIGKAQYILEGRDRLFTDSTNTWMDAFGDGYALGLHVPAIVSARQGGAHAGKTEETRSGGGNQPLQPSLDAGGWDSRRCLHGTARCWRGAGGDTHLHQFFRSTAKCGTKPLSGTGDAVLDSCPDYLWQCSTRRLVCRFASGNWRSIYRFSRCGIGASTSGANNENCFRVDDSGCGYLAIIDSAR